MKKVKDQPATLKYFICLVIHLCCPFVYDTYNREYRKKTHTMYVIIIINLKVTKKGLMKILFSSKPVRGTPPTLSSPSTPSPKVFPTAA